MGKTQRLDKVLSNSGYGTRKEVKKFIKQGLVVVGSETAKDPGMHVDPNEDSIVINGELLNYREYIYVMMNKPAGVISATFDRELETVADILPDEFKALDLFPVGRLDMDTEGLLILSNDGQLAHRILSPKKHIPKKYYALVEGRVTDDDIDKFKEGLTLDDGYKTLPSELEILSPGTYTEIELIIYEGKFHQVKRMFEAVGKKVKYLRRVEMAGLKLDETLQNGECRELTEDEVNILRSSGEL